MTWSWNYKRMELYEDAIKFWPLDDRYIKPSYFQYFGIQNDVRYIEMELYERYVEAKEFVKKNFQYDAAQFKSKDERDNFKRLLELKFSALQNNRSEKIINVNVPFFGILFDINDLGLFSGITFFLFC